MQLITILAAGASFMTLAAANPTVKRAAYPQFLPVSPDDVKSHTTPSTKGPVAAANIQTVGVYVCTDANGLGNCAYVLNIPGACSKLSRLEWEDHSSWNQRLILLFLDSIFDRHRIQ